MTYDPYETEQKREQQGPDDKRERALRSERGSRPATPVVPLSESESVAGTGAGGAATDRPARPTVPPKTPPAPPMTPAAPPATPPRTAHGAEKDPLAGPAQDPVHPVPPPGTAPKSAATSAAKSAPARETAPTSAKSAPVRETAPARETAPGRTPEATPAQTPRLIPQDQCDKLNLRLQEALTTFIDGPRHSVEEAAGVLEEAVERLTAALAERPRTLRDSWDGNGDGRGKAAADTEDLRLALRSYREVTERLLRI